MKNRITAFLLLSVLLISLCACGAKPEGVDEIVIIGETPSPLPSDMPDSGEDVSSEVIASCGEYKLTASLYTLLIYKSLESISNEYGIDIKEIYGREVMDNSGSILSAGELAEKNAASEFRKICLAFSMINELGGKLENISSYNADVNTAYEDYISQLAVYDAIGVKLSDLVIERLSDSLYPYAFSLMYGEDSEHEIPREELEAIMEERMRRIEYTFLPFYDDETMEMLPDTKIKELKAKSSEYLKRFKGGENFSDIVRENYLLLAGYDLFFDVENTEVYYSVYRSDFAAEIAEKVEKLKDGAADIVNAEYFSAVVLRLPVNGNEDERWLETALTEAYYSHYGKEFNSFMDERLISQPEEAFSPLLTVTAEKVITRIP